MEIVDNIRDGVYTTDELSLILQALGSHIASDLKQRAGETVENRQAAVMKCDYGAT